MKNSTKNEKINNVKKYHVVTESGFETANKKRDLFTGKKPIDFVKVGDASNSDTWEIL